MAYELFFEDENGNPIRKFKDGIEINPIPLAEEQNYKLIIYLNPFGDTTFNELMLDDLISDLKRINKNDREIKSLIAFIEIGKRLQHAYLKFYGD